MEFDVLPKKIAGKNALVMVDAPILTDNEAIKEACREALERVAEAIKNDVTMAQRSIFAHDRSNWSIATYGKDYYSSGLVPYWRGGLLGSFEITGSPSWSEQEMAFTASYAQAIEGGGSPSEIPLDWAEDKIGEAGQAGITYSIHPHPFTEEVARKLQEGLGEFGYLDIFAIHFGAHFRRYL